MKNSAKVAVSLPIPTLRALERARRRLKKSRSAVVAQAIEAWLRREELDEADRRYVDGYRRHPESPREVAATEAIATDAMSGWEPWK